MSSLSLESAFREMTRIRLFEEALSDLKASGAVPGSIHLCNGQEAIPVGACSNLRETDAVTATYRGHGWAISRGASLVDMFAEIMGRASSLNGGRAGSPFLSARRQNFLGENSIVGAGVPIALGAAVAAWQQTTSDVSIVTIGEGAMNQGATHEALNFAAAWDLPLILVIENNQYSEMTPWKDMVAIDQQSERAKAYGMPGVTIDGNDPFVVSDTIAIAVERARSGGGPSMVECLTERLVGHYSGDVQAYRPKGEIAEAQTREPLVRLASRIESEDPELAGRLSDIRNQIVTEVNAAAEQATRIPMPDPATVKDHVYA